MIKNIFPYWNLFFFILETLNPLIFESHMLPAAFEFLLEIPWIIIQVSKNARRRLWTARSWPIFSDMQQPTLTWLWSQSCSHPKPTLILKNPPSKNLPLATIPQTAAIKSGLQPTRLVAQWWLTSEWFGWLRGLRFGVLVRSSSLKFCPLVKFGCVLLAFGGIR